MRPKVAVVLGGGGARGLAHIGVLKALEREGVPVDLIVGTSMGAFVGGFYAAGVSVREMEELAGIVDRTFVAKMLSPTLSSSGFVDGDRIREYLKASIGELNIEQLKIPFAAVATDFETGEEVVLDSGPVVEAIMASIAIPALFKPVLRQNRFLIDGGFVNPLPVSIAHQRGADVIIAVNVARNPSRRTPTNVRREQDQGFRLVRTVSLLRNRMWQQTWARVTSSDKARRTVVDMSPKDSVTKDPLSPSMLKSMMQSMSIMENSLIAQHLKNNKPDALITPAVDGIELLAFHRAKDLIKLGEESALQSLRLIATRF
jgi:NTE family protein